MDDELHQLAALLRADRSGANGDDAAVLHVPGGRCCVTVDTAVEGVHLHPHLTPRQMGYRAAAAALSDLAAMGGAAPIAVLCSISVPAGRWGDVPDVAAGVDERAGEHGCALAGGDLVRAAPGDERGLWSVSVTCIGGAGPAGFVGRTTAQPGDALYVTGPLGGSHAALVARTRMGEGDGEGDGEAVASASVPWELYARPPRRTAAARALAPHVHAMIDLSDGLAGDVARLCEASGVGATVELERVPVHPAAAAELEAHGGAARLAATGGDDYELLVAAPPGREARLMAAMHAATAADPAAADDRHGGRLGLVKVGHIADSDLVFLHDGRPVGQLRGYQHR